jgi:hypothetical protein
MRLDFTGEPILYEIRGGLRFVLVTRAGRVHCGSLSVQGNGQQDLSRTPGLLRQNTELILVDLHNDERRTT